MALDVDKDGRVGCAYYVALDEELVLEEEIPMGGIEAVDTLLLLVQPTSVIIPNRAPGDLIEFLERDAYRFDGSEGSDGEQGSYILRHVVSAQFDYDAGKEALTKVDVEPAKPDPVQVQSLEEEPVQSIGSSSHNKLMRLAERINFESCLSVGCAGAVLNDLERRRIAEQPSTGEGGDFTFSVRSIKMESAEDTMIISADSLISLQILQSELHPNPQTRSSNSSEPKAKEALSVTGLLQALASSAQGKRRLRQILLRPSTDLAVIRERHMSIEILLRTENSEIAKNMRKQLRKLKNPNTLLRHICSEINVKRFLHVGDIIIRTIDFQLSKDSGRTEILPGASEYLDGLREEFAHEKGYIMASIIPRLMLDLDVQYGDLPSRIADEEIEVIMALAAAVLEHEEAILSASELFGELDSMLALALAAEKYNWTAPTMTASNVIDIVDGRHPLQELLVPSFIPNDCALAGGCGASDLEDDSSGKSVYMRQVALIVYLAHTGSYVPAARATIGVTDRILTRIATRETVVNDESAFLVDLKQAAFAMNFATRRSLLLIDEFGKGTTADSGSALFTAYLTYFLGLGTERPKVLAGTHFHEVFENGLLMPGEDVAFGHMDVRLDPGAEDPDEAVTFLFRLLPGRGSSSLGVLCAASNDVPSDVINRARAIVALLDNNESLLEACSDMTQEDKRRLEEAELVARRFLALEIPDRGREQGGSVPIRDMLRSVLAPGEAPTSGP
ncbi:a22c99f1-1a2f-4758-a9a1-07ceedd3614c [Thermothielavioides terrestris]|uniref:DNA mismatch repair protein MSH5 n=1 Tax=Thermothielavioides terrestris TaxID=2587410 RepID=A0A446B8Y5_9PEZI|nr:a22c99f1-1a2f-4758-a9a1-07ceedd3614c [Thermothielavioides terrestris]